MPGAPDSHDEHGLDLLSDSARDITPVVAPDLNLEQTAWPKDGGMDPATEAVHAAAIEPNADFTSYETRVAGHLDSSPATGSEPPASVPIESG